MKLEILDEIPEDFLNIQPREIRSVFPGPTLIRLKGKRSQPLFVSILLHGNETTSFYAVQRLLRKYQFSELPRSLLIFVGNVKAAEMGRRHLDGQPDYNRIWDGGDLPEQKMASEVLNYLKQKRPFACIDIHNTTGRNPHYVCTTELNSDWIRLGAAFSQTLVYFSQPREVQSKALSSICPAVTVESGLPGEESGVKHVFDYLDTCLHLEEISDLSAHERDLNLYHSFARVRVPASAKVVFCDDANYDFRFSPEFDLLNFSELQQGDLLGLRSSAQMRLIVLDEQNRDVSEDFVEYRGQEIYLKKDVVPSMFTKDERVVHQDCLGYLMLPIGADHLLEESA